MSEFDSVCANCGVEADNNEKTKMDHEVACEAGSDGHDWSDDDPMSRALARMACSTMAHTVVDTSDDDNENWQWFEVSLDDHDEVGASEMIAGDAQEEGFSFVGVDETDDGTTTLRFNRQKGGG